MNAPLHAESPYKGKTGLRRLWNALRYSIAGLKAAWACEDAFRMEVWAALVAVPLALFLPVQTFEKAMLIGSVLLVMVVELLNSAVEATVDRISLENHHLAKRAKDIGSASVLITLVITTSVWLLVLWPYIPKWLE